jgi:hypothetical protein
MQAASAEAPTDVEYFPAPQSLQIAVPGASLNFPATHLGQVPAAASPDEPALQMQFATAVLPAGDREFAGHATHVEGPLAPTAAEYLPSAQSAQTAVPAIALYFPA